MAEAATSNFMGGSVSEADYGAVRGLRQDADLVCRSNGNYSRSLVGRRTGLAFAAIGAALLACGPSAAPGAAGATITVTISPSTASATIGTTACLGLHVTGTDGSPLATAVPLIEFAKTPRGLPSSWNPPTTNANGDASFCFTVPDLGEYDLDVPYVTTSGGVLPATSNTAVLQGTFPPFPSRDLSATVLAPQSQPLVGDDYTVEITVTSAASASIEGYRLLVGLPLGAFVEATSSRGSCTGALVCDFGSIAPGDSIAVEIRLRATDAGSAVVGASWMTDPSTPNQVVFAQGSSATITVVPRMADLSLTLLPTRITKRRGHDVATRIRVVNDGPDSVDDATLVLKAPPSWLLVRPAAAANCTGSPLTCPLGPLPAGASRTFAVKVTPRRIGRVALFATVASATATDTVRTNDSRALVVTGRR